MAVYAIIGTGNMGGALAKGLCKKVHPAQVILFNRTPEKARKLADALGCQTAGSAQEAVQAADYILLGVKPYMMAGVIADIAPALYGGSVLVSMAPGITMDQVRGMAGGEYPVIRIMPNTPVAVGAGMTLYAADGHVPDAVLEEFLNDLSASGRFVRMDEHLFEAGSAVSGCGPAFAALFLEALSDGGVACGLPRAQALELAAQMMAGTAQLALSGLHPGPLKDQVCSPGGTTIQGVRALEAGGMRGAVMEAVIAAYEKSIGK
ncbi:MAG: pyrroline-5-carboxylate reductase [Clostridia bacterium]|nr:pyrroline-5-carboxylate reductase [Clostridia bacterium]